MNYSVLISFDFKCNVFSASESVEMNYSVLISFDFKCNL